MIGLSRKTVRSQRTQCNGRTQLSHWRSGWSQQTVGEATMTTTAPGWEGWRPIHSNTLTWRCQLGKVSRSSRSGQSETNFVPVFGSSTHYFTTYFAISNTCYLLVVGMEIGDTALILRSFVWLHCYLLCSFPPFSAKKTLHQLVIHSCGDWMLGVPLAIHWLQTCIGHVSLRYHPTLLLSPILS